MADYVSAAERAAQEARRYADRYDDGSENAGLLAQVEAQLSTTYALLALVAVERSRS